MPHDLDLKQPANVQDPFPVFRRLRDHDPVHWSRSLHAWVVTRYWGRPLARLEGQLTFEAILRRLPELALQSAAPRWKPQIFLRGLESLPVTWRPGSRAERRA
jgi:cytochrome P450